MAIDIFGPGAQAPPAGGVELAGVRRWVRSVLVVPTLFLVVVVVSALAGVKDWLVVLTVMSALTIVSEALLVRTGVTSLALSPACVVRRGRRRTATVRAEEVSDIFIRHLTYGPIMVVSSGDTKIGLSLPAVYRNPPARDALASFLWRAGADPSLGELGIPRPASRQRSRPASQPGQSTRQEQAHPRGAMPDPSPTGPTGHISVDGCSPALAGQPEAPSVRVKGRALAWVTFAALFLTVAIGALRFLH